MRKILLTLALMLMPLTSYGMTVDDLPITGTIPDHDGVNQYLAFFPSSVALLYTQRGGRITVIPTQRIDTIARRYDSYDSGVTGLYVYRSRHIYLATTEDIAVDLAHELGHFLYQETRPTWSAEERQRWTDTEEFARRYSRRNADFSGIEQSITKLIERHQWGTK